MSSGTVDSNLAQVPPTVLKAGTSYYIRSADRHYVQASGVLNPFKLVSSPNKNTVWKVVDVGTSGYVTIQAASGWHASGPDDGSDGPLTEDPNTATQWEPTVVTSQFLTINNRAKLFWTTRSGSDEIWLSKKNGTSGTQAWRFLDPSTTSAADME